MPADVPASFNSGSLTPAAANYSHAPSLPPAATGIYAGTATVRIPYYKEKKKLDLILTFIDSTCFWL